MGYRDYSKNDFQKLEGQINIMALFGNGVDIQLMDYLNSPYRTTYQNFYNYLCYKNFDSSNLIFQKMRNDYAIYCQKRGAEKRNWSDFENSLIDIFNEVRNELKDWELHFYGEDYLETQKKLEQKIAEYQLEQQVKFMGTTDNILKTMQEYSVYVSKEQQ